MADDRWNNDDYEGGQRSDRHYGYGYDNDRNGDRDQRGRRDEQYRDRDRSYQSRDRGYGDRGSGERSYGERGTRSSEYSSIPGIGVNYGGGGWINEYSTDWRRYADRDYPSGRGYDRDFDDRNFRRDIPTRDYPGQRQDWLQGRDRDRGPHDEWRHERGWWDRTKDEVRSWMGDSQAEHRRQADHSGRGPKGYTRSDERIREDVSDRLMADWGVDATDIEVTVASAEVTLSGTVDGRESRRRAENIAATVLGVQDVQNNLRVRKLGVTSGASSETAGQGATSSSLGATSGTTSPRH